MADIPSESSIWGWLITGLGGAVNMVEKIAASGVRPTDEHLQRLSDHVDRLIAAIDQASGCTQHSGKNPEKKLENHGQETDHELPPATAEQPVGEGPVHSSDWPINY